MNNELRFPGITLNRTTAAAVLLGFLVIADFAILLHKNSAFSAGPDSSGYCTEGKTLASGRIAHDVPLMRRLGLDADTIYIFTPLGWMNDRRAPFSMVPTYPAGVPIHQAIARRLFGESAAFVISPLASALSMPLVAAIVWELGLPLLFGVAAASVTATIPVLLQHAVQPVSDVAAMFYVLLMLWAALRADRAAAMASRRLPAIWALIAGAALGIGVWIRPTNLLAVLPLTFALRWKPRPLLWAAAGSAPFGLALAWWNNRLYGSPLRTGYGSLAEVISRSPVCASFHLHMLRVMLPLLVASVGVFVVFDRRVRVSHRVLLVVWFAVFATFYSFYSVCENTDSARFMLPAYPAIVVAFVAVLRTAVERVPSRSRIAAGILAVLLVLVLVRDNLQRSSRLRVLDTRSTDDIYPGSIAMANRYLPPDAIVLSGLMSGAFLYYDDRITARWDQVTLYGRLPIIRAAAKRAGLHWYALESEVETHPEEFAAWAPARWVPMVSNRDVTLWRLQE